MRRAYKRWLGLWSVRNVGMAVAIGGICLAGSTRPLHAADTEWTGAVSNDFFNASNWTDGVPASVDDLAIVNGGGSFPIVIAPGDQTFEIGGFQIGVDAAGGTVQQQGRTLVVSGDSLGVESAIGLAAAADARWIMTNNATILYDEPFAANGTGFDTDGTGKDFDIGKTVPEGAVGSLEMHDNSVLRISDDLKISDGGGGHGAIWLDGNALATIGSGISASGTAQVTVKGNARLVTGNSADPGDSQNGRTNEGYLTLSTIQGEAATVEVAENGKIYARTLQMRGGVSNVTLRDDAEFAVFDVFQYATPQPGVATVTGSAAGPQRTSHAATQTTSEFTLTLHDRSSFSVDADLDDSGWSGLALSGGNNRGGNDQGGLSIVEIRDQSSFHVQQDLHLALGTSEFADSTLKIVGPSASVTIGGDLRMALDESDNENLGTATLEAVLTAPTHSTIQVAGNALIGNGHLRVSFDGYAPSGGENYELLAAAGVVGGQFLSTDLPQLPAGLNWSLLVDETSVSLRISSRADFDGNGVLDANDIDLLSAAVRAGTNNTQFDLTGDNLVNADDRVNWVEVQKRTWFGDANLDGEFSSTDLVTTFQAGEYEDTVAGNSTWATGDWNGDGEFNSSDFVVAFAAGGYENGPRASVAAVPEPASALGLSCGAALLLFARRRR